MNMDSTPRNYLPRISQATRITILDVIIREIRVIRGPFPSTLPPML